MSLFLPVSRGIVLTGATLRYAVARSYAKAETRYEGRKRNIDSEAKGAFREVSREVIGTIAQL